jgi:ATP-binding cassette subfamily B protein
LENLFEFLELKPKIVDPLLPKTVPVLLEKGIFFKNVSFRYPGSEREVFKNFDLIIPDGQVVAIVGPNGAGKSTLIKLLCRLYDPNEGCIELDGINLQELRINDLRRMVSVLFQVPVHYDATVRENIALGDLKKTCDGVEIKTASQAAGADDFVANLPQAYDTLLGPSFVGGIDLSVGEWQRLCLSRAFLRQAPIIILDEPTSAMDSWAEADWLERFRKLAEGRTAIIITHRFTTAMKADVIHVMEGGRIVEFGSHSELIARDGRYAQSWTKQFEDHSRLSQSIK